MTTVDMAYRHRQRRTFAGQVRSSSNVAIVCLFSAVGLIFTTVVLMLGGSEMVSAFMLATG